MVIFLEVVRQFLLPTEKGRAEEKEYDEVALFKVCDAQRADII